MHTIVGVRAILGSGYILVSGPGSISALQQRRFPAVAERGEPWSLLSRQKTNESHFLKKNETTCHCYHLYISFKAQFCTLTAHVHAYILREAR
jgi:hypothetical protein